MRESLEERLSRSSARIISLASLFTPLLKKRNTRNILEAAVLKDFFTKNRFAPRELLFMIQFSNLMGVNTLSNLLIELKRKKKVLIDFSSVIKNESFHPLRIKAGRELLKINKQGENDYGFFIMDAVPELANLAARHLLKNPNLTTDDLTFIIERSLKYRVVAANRLLALQHTIKHLKLIVMEVPELRYQVLDKLLTATDDEEAQLLVIRLHPEPRVREKAWETINYHGKFKSTAEEVHQKLQITNSEYVFIE